MDLENATTQDLLNMLAARMSSCIFIGYEANPMQPGNVQTFTTFKGMPLEVVGLSVVANEHAVRTSRKVFHQLYQY